MNWTPQFIAKLLLCLCCGCFVNAGVGRFLPPKKGWIWRLISYLVYSFTMVNVSWIGDANPLFLFPFFLAAFLFCYQGPRLARLVYGAIFFSLLEPLCMMVDTLMVRMDDPFFSYIAPSAIKLAACLALWLLARRMVHHDQSLSLSVRLWALLGALSLAPLFSTLSFTIWQANHFDYYAYQSIVRYIAYTILPFAMLSALALLGAIIVLSRHEMLEQRRRLAEVQEVYYAGLAREQEWVRTLRHDLHNHIATAQVLLANGDNAAAQDYLDKLSRSPAVLGSKRHCENTVANALISSKVKLMDEKGIAHDIQASLPSGLPLADIELCALLGNALDNAVEAAEKASDKNVRLRARAAKGMFMLRVENSFGEAPRQKNGKWKTSKNDAVSHGLGFASMEEIARRYGGLCDATYDQSSFRLLVSIPLPEEVGK